MYYDFRFFQTNLNNFHRQILERRAASIFVEEFFVLKENQVLEKIIILKIYLL